MVLYICKKIKKGKFIMIQKETEQKVQTMLANQLNLAKEKVSMDALIVEDLGADSLDIVEMLMTLEEEFSISLSDEQAQNLRTVKDICELVESLQK